jgi:anti-sigma regulatory factor (Ser/Thr protein kinase)
METTVRAEPRGHIVQFYEHDEQLIRTAGAYLVDGLAAGEVAIILATEPHRRAFEKTIAEAGVDVAEARESGRLITLDAEETLGRFLLDDWPDQGRFDEVVGGLVRRASAGGRRVRAYGEMVALLWDAGHVSAAIELEALWNQLGHEVTFSLFCAYPSASVAGHDHAGALAEVCGLHSAVIDDRPPSVDRTGSRRREQTRAFPKGPRAPGAARRFVADTLRRWGHHGLVRDASIVTSELVTNAVLHAESDTVVTVSSTGDAVRVAVKDNSRVAPAYVTPQGSRGGRGLHLIAALSSQWSTELVGDGKIVWSQLDLGSPVVS